MKIPQTGISKQRKKTKYTIDSLGEPICGIKINRNRTSAKTFSTPSFIDDFGGSKSQEITFSQKCYLFKAKKVSFWVVFAKWLKTCLGFLHQTVVIYPPFAPPPESRDAKVFYPLSTFLAISRFSGIRKSEMAKSH